MSNDQSPASIEESRLRGAIDDVIIVPLVLIAITAITILRLVISS